jgi:hypothetical protein
MKHLPKRRKEADQNGFPQMSLGCPTLIAGRAQMLLAALIGCTQQQSSADLKAQAAQATAEVKRDAQN